ncbi:MAG: PEP-CTERM sorting domain-containing protein [Bryobacteraceae bacterium]
MKITFFLVFMLANSMYASTVDLLIASDPSQWSTLTTNLAITQHGLDQMDSVNWTQAITTAGPVRSGYFQIQTGGDGGSLAGAGGTLVTGFAGGPVTMIDPQYGNTATVDIAAHCHSGGLNGECSPGNGYYGHYNLIPVTLGTSITLESVGNLKYDPVGYIWNDPTVVGGYLLGTFQFRFLEADGVTPVAVSDAPEPATWSMIGLSVVGAALLRKRRSMIDSEVKVAPFFLLLPLGSSASVLTSSVSCSAPTDVYGSGTYIEQHGTSSCTVDGFLTNLPRDYGIALTPAQHASASTSGSYLLSANGISGTIHANAAGYPMSDATAQIELKDTFTTAGPVRQGLVAGYFSTDFSHYAGGGGTSILSPALSRYTSSGSGSDASIPFTLGQPFTLDILSSAYSRSDDDTLSYYSTEGTFSYKFFEADGVTPVALSEAPEPSTYALAGFSLVGVALFRRRLQPAEVLMIG